MGSYMPVRLALLVLKREVGRVARDVWAVRINTKTKVWAFWCMVGKTKVRKEKKTEGVTMVRTHDLEARAETQ